MLHIGVTLVFILVVWHIMLDVEKRWMHSHLVLTASLGYLHYSSVKDEEQAAYWRKRLLELGIDEDTIDDAKKLKAVIERLYEEKVGEYEKQ